MTPTLHGQYTGRPGMPGVFTLNGKRCATTIILAAATTAGVTAAAVRVSTWDTPPGKFKPEKLHGKQPACLTGFAGETRATGRPRTSR